MSDVRKSAVELAFESLETAACLPDTVREFAVRADVLPLFWDAGGLAGYNRGAVLCYFNWEGTEIRKIDDPRESNIAVSLGAKIFPSLAELVVRPSNARVCPDCNGTGTVSGIDRQLADTVLCYCGGLGWIPPQDPRA